MCIDDNDDEMLKLDNQLCFALYVSSKEIIKKYKPVLDPLDLTYTSYIVMLVLWETDNVNIRDIGKRLYLDSGTLTPILKKLEARGYVQRCRCDVDERNVYIKLTEKGRELKIEARKIPDKILCSTGLNLSDARELLALLKSNPLLK